MRSEDGTSWNEENEEILTDFNFAQFEEGTGGTSGVDFVFDFFAICID